MHDISNSIYRDLSALEKIIRDEAEIKLFNYNGLDIPFSGKWRKIAINLSGGADSACLTYLLCKIITENNFNCKIDVITHVRCWTTRPWQQPISVKIFTKLKNMFPDIINQRYENFIAPQIEHGVIGYIYKDLETGEDRSGDQLQVSEFNIYCAYKHRYNAIFNATSMNPPQTDFPKKMKDREKQPEHGALRDLILHVTDDGNDDLFLCHPFRFVDKSWIVAQYYKYNILDLFELTRSCEGDVTHENIKSVVPDFISYSSDQVVPECGTCFWCLERNWALSNVNEVLEKIKDV
jgi:hypothetical protein